MTTRPDTSVGSSTASERVREVFLRLAKLIGARTIYTANNPTLTSFAASFYRAVKSYFELEKELGLRVEQYRLLWHDQVVYENEDRGGSIAFILFKDGVGEITLYPTVTTGELDQLVDILRAEIHDPSPNSDVVTRLWNADFANVSYRILEEDPTGQLEGERGAGARARVSPLQADDHPPTQAEAGTEVVAPLSIADYLLGVVNATRPQTTDAEKEQYIQDMLSTLFSSSTDEKRAFVESYVEDSRTDKIAMLVETAADFTRSDVPAHIENAVFLLERAGVFAVDEAEPRTLLRVLTLVREQVQTHPEENVRAMAARIEKSLTAGGFLRTLGRREGLPTDEVLGALRYLRAVGPAAVPVIHELMHIHKKSAIHREACDALIAVAGDKLDEAIDALDVDNVHIARDVVYLLGAIPRAEVPPLLNELVHYPDEQVREGALDLLTHIGDKEAAGLMCVLLDDESKKLRMRAVSALADIGGTRATSRILELCFTEAGEGRDPDERTKLFEAAGRMAGNSVADRLEETLKKKSWIRLGGGHASRDHKLLAVAALKNASGKRPHRLLESLASDSDDEVRAAAQRALVDASGPGGDFE